MRPVGGNLQVLVIRVLLQQLRLDECGLMLQGVVLQETHRRTLRRHAHRCEVLLHHYRAPHAIARAVKLRSSLFERQRREEMVARVHEDAVFARCHGDALVHGIVYALVRFAHPSGDAAGVGLQIFLAAVGGTAVHHDEFIVLVRLRQHRRHRAA